MIRVVVSGEKYSMAYGVDRSPMIGTFVQVWDHTVGDGEPCFDPEETDYYNGILQINCSTMDGKNLTEEYVMLVAKKFSIPLEKKDVYECFGGDLSFGSNTYS